jgi:hypothetical protein
MQCKRREKTKGEGTAYQYFDLLSMDTVLSGDAERDAVMHGSRMAVSRTRMARGVE